MAKTRVDELREWLHDKRLDVISERSGLSRQTLYMIRIGKTVPTMATYDKLEPLMRAGT